MSLEYVIGISAGIGRSFAEANAALKVAKENKLDISGCQPEEAISLIKEAFELGHYSIHLYDGPPKRSKPVFKEIDSLEKDLEEDLVFLDDVKERYGAKSLAYDALESMVKKRKHDPLTGALSPYGYLFKKKTEKIPISFPNGIEHFTVLIDGNNMKYWNDHFEYNDVSAHLAALGQALVKGVRKGGEKHKGKYSVEKKLDAGVPDLVLRPGFVTRTHGSAGDEFVLDLYCKEEDVVNVVKRLFDQTYAAQKELYFL